MLELLMLPVYWLILRPVILWDYHKRLILSVHADRAATPDNLHPCDKMHWADYLACKYGYFTRG